MEFSLVLSGQLACNALCSYCSATGISPEDFKRKGCKKEDYGKPKWDWGALKKIFDTNPIIKEHINHPEKTLTVNFWGSEPLLWTKECDKYTDWIDKNYPTLKYQLFISTNGMLFGAKHIQEWIYKEHEKHKLQLQLSHDGLGQYIRTKHFDPLYDERTKDFVVKLAKDGILNMINATLNNFNCSPIANKAYFDKWRFDNGLEKKDILIKLNHNNDAEYTLDYKLTGENLRRYIHEMELLWQQSYLTDAGWNPENYTNQLWHSYSGYFRNQMTRWQPFASYGGCAQFSRGEKDWTWCCNSLGEYVFCQLCNNNEDNPNPTVEQGPECKDCEYHDMDDCHGCPDMVFANHCEYKKEYMRLVLRMKQFCAIVDNFRNERGILYSKLNQLTNQKCNCNNNKPNMEYLKGCTQDNGASTGICNSCVGNNFTVWSKARERYDC
mgnify:CR=1 FL=1